MAKIKVEDARIVFVHGLASKPPEAALSRQWRRALIASVRVDSKALALRLEKAQDLFRFAYWANAVPDHIEDSAAYVNRLKETVGRVITCRRTAGNELHISKSGWVAAKVKRFGLGVVDTLAKALTVKDDVMNEHVRELRLYAGDQYVADRIREPLERELRDAWNAKKNVVVISHSMGTFVAYDVLWRFSHRSEPEYRRFRKKTVALLITMGSPLGDSALRDFMLIERWKDAPAARTRAEQRRYFPTNIERWHNYSALGDVVCHDATLEDDLFAGLRAHVGGYGAKDLSDYAELHNPYVTTKGKPNPHKSYGYLVQPKLSQKLLELLR